MEAQCNNCGRVLLYDGNVAPESRPPCPTCGSKTRGFFLSAGPGQYSLTGGDVGLSRRIFLGREEGLERLSELMRGRYAGVRITGPRGAGKSSMMSHWLDLHQDFAAAWFDPTSPNFSPSIEQFIYSLRTRESQREKLLVVFDNTDYLSDEELAKYVSRLRNWKVIENIVVLESRQTREGLRGFDEIVLQPWFEEIPKAFTYEIDKATGIRSHSELDEVIAPRIITINDHLITNLKRKPEALYGLDPRKFEELIADLLADQGCEVELTQQTRDGGKDIIAKLDTPVGKVITLVDTKRYKKTNLVDVTLVRQLVGVLVDHSASHAMLVTTSGYTKDARAYERRHDYRLSLKEFEDVKQWINRYKGV